MDKYPNLRKQMTSNSIHLFRRSLLLRNIGFLKGVEYNINPVLKPTVIRKQPR